jgi:hypothetical protein
LLAIELGLAQKKRRRKTSPELWSPSKHIAGNGRTKKQPISAEAVDSGEDEEGEDEADEAEGLGVDSIAMANSNQRVQR